MAALTLLGGLDGLDDAVAVAGGSLPYLAAVARFAADLAARGRVLPVLAAEGDGYAARWCPVLGGADAQRGRDLAAAMPPSCRAVAGVGARVVAGAAPWNRSPMPRRGLASPVRSCPRGEAVLRLAFRWPNDSWLP